MDNNTRKIAVQKYFSKRPDSPDYAAELLYSLGGIVVLLIGISMQASIAWLFIVTGAIVVIIQVVKMVQKHEDYKTGNTAIQGKATDEQMDEWLKNDKQMILNESLQTLDLESDDANASPLMIDGPAAKALIARGDDHILRYSAHNMLIFYLTEHHVATYQCILDMATGCILSQHTREFPYKDITNLETSTVNKSVQLTNNIKTAAHGYQEFSLHTSGGNNISIGYLFSKSIRKEEDYILPPSHAETTIKAIRKRLKEYKDRFSVGADGQMIPQ